MNTIDMPDFDKYQCLTKRWAVGHKDREDLYYEKVYHQLAAGEKVWNWSAAIFGLWWFLYRKLYTYGIIYYSFLFLTLLGTSQISVLKQELIKTPFMNISFQHLIIFIIFLFVHIYIGYNANTLYLNRIREKIKNNYHVATLTKERFESIISVKSRIKARLYYIFNIDVFYWLIFFKESYLSLNLPTRLMTLQFIVFLSIIIVKALFSYYFDKYKVKRALEQKESYHLQK